MIDAAYSIKVYLGINLNAEYDESMTDAAYSVSNIFLKLIFIK